MPQGKNCPKRMISPCGVGAFFPKVSTEEICSEEDASLAHPTLNQKQGTIVNVVALGLIPLGTIAATARTNRADGSGNIRDGNATPRAAIGKTDPDRIITAPTDPDH